MRDYGRFQQICISPASPFTQYLLDDIKASIKKYQMAIYWHINQCPFGEIYLYIYVYIHICPYH